MVRSKIARILFALGMVAVPLSYGVKNLIGQKQLTWVDPTFVIGAAILALTSWRMKDRWGWFLIPLAFLSASLGWYMHRVEPGHGHSAAFFVMTAPVNLALNLVWFWVCVSYFNRDRQFAVRWLSIGTILQLVVAIYVYLAVFGLAPWPSSFGGFPEFFRAHQTIWLGSLGVPRMAGTFTEGPLFGLYMLSSFVVLILELRKRRPERRAAGLIWLGVACAGIGLIGSLADQVLIGAAAFMLALGLTQLHKPGLRRWAIVAVGLTMVVYEGYRFRVKSALDARSEVVTPGESQAAREWGALYALKILAQKPGVLFWGIGPDRFGDYASKNVMYMSQSTVTLAVTPVEWLVGYGVIGLAAICLWLYKIGSRSWSAFGLAGLGALAALLLGDMFQARWLWEGWFTALAYLYAVGAPTGFRNGLALTTTVPMSRPEGAPTLVRVSSAAGERLPAQRPAVPYPAAPPVAISDVSHDFSPR